MSMSNASESAFLNLLFNNTDWANVGDAAGLQNSAAAGSFYVALHTADPLKEVLLLQEQRDLEKELSAMADDVSLLTLEADFIRVAGDYSDSKGIDYAVWREVGVPAETLAKAGIKRA